ncbi:hypothetical protein [Pseudogulbenkiania subflava]|uniref:Uncharacterized protein n=1 Tax=Pseudogulbenkiania subflava DSM 22618 TaxID=1123014 RepID=A0A1Y6C863_9NEIS|nr:hypothetical protein [Pseudogulbenkiania subflava]SMF48755.1 hypothetical protein SAMN02745746_03598 [Pseudogulbenkiania subflava DSM 22618]
MRQIDPARFSSQWPSAAIAWRGAALPAVLRVFIDELLASSPTAVVGKEK